MAEEKAPAAPLTVTENIVVLPAAVIGPEKANEYVLPLAKDRLSERTLLRFEAVVGHEQEAGYADTARLSVNGVTLDGSHFPVNWGEQREFHLPNLHDKPCPVYLDESKTWMLRYDCDGCPPAEESRYYSPELATKYVYMFPIGKLLTPGENRIRIENTSKQYPLRLFTHKPDQATQTVRNLQCNRVGPTSVQLAWESELARFEIDHRKVGQQAWQTIRNVHAWENPYNVIMLEPDTAYQFRLRGLPQSVADLEGTVTSSQQPQSPIATAKTKAESEPRTFAGLQLNPTRPMPGGLSYYPCIESYGGYLWVVDGSLRLIKLDPKTLELVYQRKSPLATWPMQPPTGYMGIPDTTVLGDKLWVTFNVQPSARPGYTIDQSRQYLLSYDFATDMASRPVVVEPTRPNSGTWEGGVEAWGDKLWVMHMDAWPAGQSRQTRIVLRTFADGIFGPPLVYDDCPTTFPYGPAISVYNDVLVLLFSDLSDGDRVDSLEPLLYSTFDGTTFTRAKPLQDVGRSRYGKGVQLGDRFFCVYKCSAPYYRQHGYQFHDIALTVFTPGSDQPPQTAMYVDDRKYNSSPDMALHNGRLFVVYNKIEHLYGKSSNPAIFHGDFIGTIVPVGEETGGQE